MTRKTERRQAPQGQAPQARAEGIDRIEGAPPGEAIDLAEPESVPGVSNWTPADATLQDWLLIHKAQESGYTCYLYRVDPQNDRRHWLIRTYQGEAPTAEQVGTLCGAGRYKLAISTVGKGGRREMTSIAINIDPSFRGVNAPPAGQGNGTGPTDSTQQTLAIMAAFVNLISPLIGRGNGNGSATADPMLMAQVNQYQVFSQMLQHQARENVKLYGDLTRSALAQSGEGEGEEYEDERAPAPAVDSGIASWLPAILQFAPVLLGKGPAADAAAAAVKALPQYAEVAADDRKFQALAREVEKTLGTKKTRALIARLK
jgi:hypothetical protein